MLLVCSTCCHLYLIFIILLLFIVMHIYNKANHLPVNPVLILTHLWLMFGSLLDNNGVYGTRNELCQALGKQTTVIEFQSEE